MSPISDFECERERVFPCFNCYHPAGISFLNQLYGKASTNGLRNDEGYFIS